MRTTIVFIKPSGYFERLIHGPYKEAYLKVGVSKDGGAEVSCMVGMSDKGFGFILDSAQFNGDSIWRHIKSERVKVEREINSHAFWHAVGRTHVDGVKLDSFKAISYILGIDGWRTATYKTLFNV